MLSHAEKPARSGRANSAPGWLWLIPLLILWAFFLFTGWLGIDFGAHWDEGKQILAVQHALVSEILLPGWYKYPSVSFWLTASTTLPHLLLAARNVDNWQAAAKHLLGVIQTPAFLLQTRLVFLGISSLAILWIFLALRAARRSWLEALFAAGVLGLSWEIGYHARWIAPDTILMQFAALVVLTLSLAFEHPHQRRWIYLSALAAGLGAGTKYPGGLLILPVLMAGYQTSLGGFWRRSGSALLEVGLFFIIGYLGSTPGTILEPVQFFKDVRFEVLHYRGGGLEQTVTPGFQHLGLILDYLARSLFSPYTLSALFFFVLSLLGIYAMARRSRRLAIWMVTFPLAYLLYFSFQSILVVRNLLAVAPFLAALAGWGAGWVAWRLKSSVVARAGWWIVLFLALATNAIWLYQAAFSIDQRSSELSLLQFTEYAAERPAMSFTASERVWQELAQSRLSVPANIERYQDVPGDALAVYVTEVVKDAGDWPLQSHGLIRRVFGPLEVNLNYYPLWIGEDHLVLLDGSLVSQLGLSPAP